MLSVIGKIFLKLIGGTRNERLVRARAIFVREHVNVAEQRLLAEYAELIREAAKPWSEQVDEDTFAAMAEDLSVVPLAARPWLREKTVVFRRRLDEGETIDAIMPEAFATVRIASWLARDHRQFDVQFVAGQLLYEGTVAEEATGEGKTVACYPAVYLAVLEGKKVHVVSTNDFLVKRDRDFASPIFDLLGMKVGHIQHPMSAVERKVEYACDVVYGSNSEFGFDYLRDNMKLSVDEQAQGSLDYAIIDEVDSILIDEARTPLILSGPAYGDVDRYRKADAVAREILSRHKPYAQVDRRVDSLKRQMIALEGERSKSDGDKSEAIAKRLEKARADLAEAERELATKTKHYDVELDRKSAHLTHEGITAAQDIAGIGSFYVGANMEWPHLMDQSLRAHVVYECDKDYVVRGDEVVIVDEFTGRLMEGRQWADGLHQAVEAKERVTVQEENQTQATITYQNLFRLYGKLAGMTGTAMTEAEEFMKIFKLDVVAVPTHRPVNRVDHEDRIFGTIEEKKDAIIEEVNHYSKMGRPVLVGTTSIEKSEDLSRTLERRYGIEHLVLNGRVEESAREGEIVKLAGQQRRLKSGSKKMVGNVTIATNMAGRGTDIKLGPGVVYDNCGVPSRARLAELGVEYQDLYPAGVNKCCIHCQEYDPATSCAHCFKPKIDPDFPARGRTECTVEVPCGLHIIGTERHEARRIDNQLRGRSGRQGDPGSSRFFLSLRDDLMAIFAGEWTVKVLGWLGLQDGQPIEHKRISKGISRAQKKVEQRNFDIRKHLLEMDEVMDHQRRGYYERRQQVLEGRDIEGTIREMIADTIAAAVGEYLADDYVHRCVAEWARQGLDVNVRPDQIRGETLNELPLIEEDLRRIAKEEAAGTISVTLGEYADPDVPRKEWDLRGLSSWAMSRFSVNVSQNQLRAMTPEEMEQTVVAAAMEHIDTIDLSGLQRYLAPGYAYKALAEWARNRFGVELTPDELARREADYARGTIVEAVDAVYLSREIEYPVEYAIDISIGKAGPDNAYAAKALCEWVNRKYDAGWSGANLAGKTIEQIRDELVDVASQFVTGGGMEKAVADFVASLPAQGRDETVIEWAKQRLDTELTSDDLAGGDPRAVLLDAGRAFARRELTELERYVLLQIYDSSWVDHLLAMDHLKGGVSLRSYAEQDPKIAYKREGYRLFEEMLANIEDKVTDIIFKVRLEAGSQMRSVYNVSQMVHEQLTAYDHLAQDMAAQQAAAQPQRIETIIRGQPKVGRNDPCPCGSGKKFKKCCGRNV